MNHSKYVMIIGKTSGYTWWKWAILKPRRGGDICDAPVVLGVDFEGRILTSGIGPSKNALYIYNVIPTLKNVKI